MYYQRTIKINFDQRAGIYGNKPIYIKRGTSLNPSPISLISVVGHIHLTYKIVINRSNKLNKDINECPPIEEERNTNLNLVIERQSL